MNQYPVDEKFLKGINKTAAEASDKELLVWKQHVEANPYNEAVSEVVLGVINCEMIERGKRK